MKIILFLLKNCTVNNQIIKLKKKNKMPKRKKKKSKKVKRVNKKRRKKLRWEAIKKMKVKFKFSS